MNKLFFSVLFLYVIGSILFVIAPIYRYLDKLTPNVSYLEISGTGCFVVSNVILWLNVMKRRKSLNCRKFSFKIIILTLYVMGASSFLIGAAYRLVDSKTLINVYIDLSASCYFTVGSSFDLALYVIKSCQGKHLFSKKYVYKYSIKIMYPLGSLLFLSSSIYRLFDYVTDNTLFIDTAAIGGFLVPNTMLFIVFLINSHNKTSTTKLEMKEITVHS